MWRGWRAARTAYSCRPKQEWSEMGVFLGRGQADSAPLHEARVGRGFCVQSAESLPGGGAGSRDTRVRESPGLGFRGGDIVARAGRGVAFSSGSVGKIHDVRAFSSEVEEGKDAEQNELEEESSGEEEDESTEREVGSGSRRRGNANQIRGLWARVESIPRSKANEMVPLLVKWKAEGKKLDKSGILALLNKLKRRSRYRQAIEVLDWFSINHPKEIDGSALGLRIDLYGKQRLGTSPEEIFNSSPAELKTASAYKALLSFFVARLNTAKAESLFATMKEAAMAADSYAYNQMLLLYKRKSMPEKFKEVLDEMHTRGIAYDGYTYNILLDLESKEGNIGKVEELYAQMKADAGVALDAATCGTLIVAYASAGQFDKADEFIKMLGHVPFRKKEPVFEILIRVFAGMNNVEYVEKVWSMVKKGPVVTTQCYVALIESYGRLGLVSKAEEAFAEMEKDRGLIATSQYNAMISVYASNNAVDKAEGMLARLDASPRVHRNALTYHKFVSTYLQSGQSEKAAEFLRIAGTSTKRSKAVPWFDTLFLLLENFGAKGDILNSEKQFQDIKKTYRRATLKVYNALLTAYLNARERPGGFLERMAADNIKPSDETLALLEQMKSATDSTPGSQNAASETVLSASS